MKGRRFLRSEAEQLLVSLGLDKKRSALVRTLSGGMKRKLSVAIALVGGSEVKLLC